MLTEITRNEDTIDVKYDSSNIGSSTYNVDEKTLYVSFIKGGKTYKYDNVESTDYTSFQNAESTGKAFIEFIKNKYNGIVVDGLSKT